MDLRKELHDRGFSTVIVFKTYIDAVYGDTWIRYWRDEGSICIANQDRVSLSTNTSVWAIKTFISMVESYLSSKKAQAENNAE